MVSATTLDAAAVVALALRYPTDDGLTMLRAAVASLPRGGPARELRHFVDAVADREPYELEELYTRTFDLAPLVAPYVGHLAWGDSYQRGAFMAELRGAMRTAGIDPGGELPDHLEPILRYLAATDRPLEELGEVLVPAITKMERELRKADPRNPYRRVLAAARIVAEERTR
jgi:Nitrate reductase delta subunit